MHSMPSKVPTLRPATDADRAFCEALSRGNMTHYREAREIVWDPARFLASWAEFENHIIVVDGVSVGTLRLLAIDDALEIRDLQLLASHQGQGIGSWALETARTLAVARGFGALRLRVFPENPAHRLYSRFGFEAVATENGVVHMLLRLPTTDCSPSPPPVHAR